MTQHAFKRDGNLTDLIDALAHEVETQLFEFACRRVFRLGLATRVRRAEPAHSEGSGESAGARDQPGRGAARPTCGRSAYAAGRGFSATESVVFHMRSASSSPSDPSLTGGGDRELANSRASRAISSRASACFLSASLVAAVVPARAGKWFRQDSWRALLRGLDLFLNGCLLLFDPLRWRHWLASR